MRLKGHIVDWTTAHLTEESIRVVPRNDVEIELPLINPKDLKEGMEVLVKVILKEKGEDNVYPISSENIVYILPTEPKVEVKREKTK